MPLKYGTKLADRLPRVSWPPWPTFGCGGCGDDSGLSGAVGDEAIVNVTVLGQW
jgi:hypothetical protein